MAYLTFDTDKLQHNHQFLDEIFQEHNIQWDVVTKMLCGNDIYLEQVKDLGFQTFHDARLHNLKAIKNQFPGIKTGLIKIPPPDRIPDTVRYADLSLNTELPTLKALSREALKQDKQHEVIVMVELGDLREGVMPDDLVDFVKEGRQLSGINITGLGVSLNCLHGVLPTKEKLQELIDHRDRLEKELDIELPVVSGGSSVMIPLFFEDQIPEGITHFRVGETLYFGNNLITGEPIEGMKQNSIRLHGSIIELKKKPLVPWGELGMNVMGEEKEFDEDLKGKSSYRAIMDVGQIDVSPQFLTPIDDTLDIIGASSDMMVVNLHDNPNNYQIGDYITWDIDYIGTVQLMNSPYVDKKLK